MWVTPEVDVLVQVGCDAGRRCEGRSLGAVDEPVRMLVVAGDQSVQADADTLADALLARLGQLGAGTVEDCPLCHRQGNAWNCVSAAHGFRQVLVYVAAPDHIADDRETVAEHWVGNRDDAVAVLNRAATFDLSIPEILRDRHAAVWDTSIEEVTIDVLTAAGVVSADQRAFISYSHADGTDLARALFKMLTAARFEVFLDNASLVTGTRFAERIEHRLVDAAFVVVVDTAGARGSDWVKREIAFAGQAGATLAGVGEGTTPQLDGLTSARWVGLEPDELAGELHDDGLRVVQRLREIHAKSLAFRRRSLERSLRCEIQYVSRGRGSVEFVGGMLKVNAVKDYRVAIHPRPAGLREMRGADRRCPPLASPVVISPRPSGGQERDELRWLAARRRPAHGDASGLEDVVRDMGNGTL